MPPFLPRKRLRSPSPEAGPSKPAPKVKPKPSLSTPRKSTLFDDLDAGTSKKRTAKERKAILEKLNAEATDDESSLSSLSEDDFEDVLGIKQQDGREDSNDSDEDIEFEDVETAPAPSGPVPSGDLELTLRKDNRISLVNASGTKRGPSKIERQIRISTHQMHVQLLMFHNAIRNAWLCDEEVQDILVKHLTPNAEKAIEKWRRNCGIEEKKKEPPKEKGKGKAKERGKGRGKIVEEETPDARSRRDWGDLAEKLEKGDVNMSNGDPLFKLLEELIRFWQQQFRITVPGLRKMGYMSLERLDEETKSFQKDDHDPERHGERIRDIEEFKECAKTMEGSRDVGAQLFTALLRGIGFEARLVSNLQPAGFAWSQYEESSEKNPRALKKANAQIPEETSSDEESGPDEKLGHVRKDARAGSKTIIKAKPTTASRNLRGNKEAPIDLFDSELLILESDEKSVVDVTPAKRTKKPSLPYDKDLLAPTYWTEVLSPISKEYVPVDATVLLLRATEAGHYEKFLPPQKSEKVKHITSYVVGHCSDGTAKDVTTRYLKGKMWPGRTKGYRLPPEKIPIYDRKGKIKRYESYSWFKTVMSGYVRGTKKCPRDEIDDFEEVTILQPAKREKKVVEEGKESLQYFKTSPEFVLERHLKREEALVPTAKHVKMFTVKGKGENSTEEKVYLRKDVVNCKSMETWHKEGRAPQPGEQPLKRVPYRAATTNRRRELAEAEQASGGKVLQGLFSKNQTDWIIPPPIQNGIIPKNSFGNIDLYVDSMLPEGAVHIPYRGTVKICKRLSIDYAEAVTGFEFGHRMAVPVIEGVVVAEEHYPAIMDQWEQDEVERRRKEDTKRQKAVINMWRKMLMGMRIVKRIKEDYGSHGGDEIDALNPWASTKWRQIEDDAAEIRRQEMTQKEEDTAGGFFHGGHHEEEVEASAPRGFFPTAHDADNDDGGGGFILEDHNENPGICIPTQAYSTPESIQSHTKPAVANEEDDEMGDALSEPECEPEVAQAPAKRRGRPSLVGTAVKSKPVEETNPSTNRQVAQQRVKSARKRKMMGGDKESSSPSLSDLESEQSNSEDMEDTAPPLKRAKKTPAKRTTRVHLASLSKPVTRKTPKRSAARKSETALKSHYFEQSDDNNDEDE
ncbi:putative DNA repair protein rhp42 [Amylocarpus encephaloides]|uniref:DNA repair protein rhp42 n=1 Tax=Amylocarpus encephaloides TaxID=45428 RepID=A0A9P7YPY6_9HELO|nr:putative DNA repair protein rhp42 [Amylocarpus encephaloides]